MRLLFALAAVLLLPTAAEAAGPRVTEPGRPLSRDAIAQTGHSGGVSVTRPLSRAAIAQTGHSGGVSVTWPEQRTYAPGEELTVKVVSERRMRVALVRESASGKVLRTIARRTLRRGTFSAAAPVPGRYSLRVGSRSRDFAVAAKPVSSPPFPPDAPVLGCARDRGDRAELRLGTATVQPGGTLPAELVNTSGGCLLGGVGYLFERLQPDGTWARVPTNLVFVAVGVILAPGQTYPKQVQIPADFTPGSYRLRDSVYGANGAIELTARFEVVA